jgi:hypothetical protein
MASEIHDKFVKDMIERSKKNEEAKPQNSSTGIDTSEIENLTTQIKERIQKGRTRI